MFYDAPGVELVTGEGLSKIELEGEDGVVPEGINISLGIATCQIVFTDLDYAVPSARISVGHRFAQNCWESRRSRG